jgi:hypothetical protein
VWRGRRFRFKGGRLMDDRHFHFTIGALVLGMMGVYLPPPPVETGPDETTVAVDHLLESELDRWLEGLPRKDPRPGPETRGGAPDDS